MLMQGRLHGGESVSKELYGSALSLADNRGLLDSGRADIGSSREEFMAEIEDVVARLARIGAVDAQVLEEVLVDQVR